MVNAWCDHSLVQLVGLLHRESKVPSHPELSALNAILREMRCGEKLPQLLANAIFTSPQSANHAQYVDAPYTRPHNYTGYPFRLTLSATDTQLWHDHDPDCDHCVQSAILRAQLDPSNTEMYSPQVHRPFMRALRASNAFVQRASDGALEPYNNPEWVHGEFVVDCLIDGSEVIRHQHEAAGAITKAINGTLTNKQGVQILCRTTCSPSHATLMRVLWKAQGWAVVYP